MEHWTDEFEHESITADNKEAFNTAMSKYDSEEAAVVGGFNAMKEIGKPYKLPESLDKLPDDKVKGEFTSQVRKLFGIELADSVESLADLDLKTGLAEGVEPDETLANTFKQFVVENKINKTSAQKMVGFYNQMMTKARQDYATAAEAQKTEAANKTNEALIAHFGSKEKVVEQSELLRRAVQNHAGLTAEEYEQVGEELADSMLTKNPVMAKAMLTLLSPLAAEGLTDNGVGGNHPPKEKTTAEVLPETAKALGWNK